jgi:hypothetical protein
LANCWRHAHALAAPVALAAAIGGCSGTPVESRLTVFNANPHRVTITVPGSTVAFSLAACAMAEFTWAPPGGWKAESGADAPDGSRPLIPIYSRGPGGDEGPAQFVDIVSGTSYLEYPTAEAPAFPSCRYMSGSASPSG